MQQHPFLSIATSAARAAARLIMQFSDRIDTLQITEKNRNDLVTEVDKLSEEIIIEHIHKAYPRHNILGEESGLDDKHSDYCWIIDPLDGTMNFIHGFPHFAISIAVKKHDQLEVACIYDPIRQELFTAVNGKGAQVNNRRMRVSETKKLDNSLIGTGFPFSDPSQCKPYIETLEKIMPQVAGIRRPGAATLDLAYVAAGRMDGFWESNLKPWDIAAGALLIQESGGLITDYRGKKEFLENGNVIAGNPKIHEALFNIIRS